MEKYKDLYKYLDVLIQEAEIAKTNCASTILYKKHIFPEEYEIYDFREFCDNIVSLGNKLNFFKFISKDQDWFELTEKGISANQKGGYYNYLDFIEKKELKNNKQTIIAENYIGGNNYGIQSSKSDFTVPITINPNPSNNPEIKSSLQKALSNPYFIGVVLIAIEEITLGNIYKYIISII